MSADSIFGPLNDGEAVPFIDGWDFIGKLGEGSYGEVRLIYNAQSKLKCAVKIVNMDGMSEYTKKTIERERKVHKTLSKHPNIIKYMNSRYEAPLKCTFIFMEYAEGGELFDKLVPDIGMPESEAKFYFKQLLNGVKFIHSKNLCHRDLKPENLLLTMDGRLKIIDFGIVAPTLTSTGVTRQYTDYCGTPPYMAPEVVQRQPYKGKPGDVWSVGICLVAMLAGMLPWLSANDMVDQDYLDWTCGEHANEVWDRVSIEAIELLRKIFNPQIDERPTIAEIENLNWVTMVHKDDIAFKVQVQKRLKLSVRSDYGVSISQPVFNSRDDEDSSDTSNILGEESTFKYVIKNLSISSASQPMDGIGYALSQCDAQSRPVEIRVPRLTRIWFDTSGEHQQEEVIDEIMGRLTTYEHKERIPSKYWRFTCPTTKLVFEMGVYDIRKDVFMADFKRCRGCALHFKRVFRDVKKALHAFECKDPGAKVQTQEVVVGLTKKEEGLPSVPTNIPDARPLVADVKKSKHKSEGCFDDPLAKKSRV